MAVGVDDVTPRKTESPDHKRMPLLFACLLKLSRLLLVCSAANKTDGFHTTGSPMKSLNSSFSHRLFLYLFALPGPGFPLARDLLVCPSCARIVALAQSLYLTPFLLYPLSGVVGHATVAKHKKSTHQPFLARGKNRRSGGDGTSVLVTSPPL